MSKNPFFIIVYAVFLAVASLSCTTPGTVKNQVVAINEPWVRPLPPETPRVQFIQTIITPEDLGIKKGFFAKVWEFIAGKDTVDRIISPHGVAGDDNGKLYVADWGGACIHFFDFKEKKYNKFFMTKQGPLASPIGAALDADGLLYITDSALRRVFVFSGKKNKRIIGDDSLLRPTGIAVNKKEKILYVVDTRSHRVELFDLEGRKTGSFGTHGTGESQFNNPTHIALDSAGDVYIMDTLNYRVQIFDQNGRFKSAFGGIGTAIGSFVNPKGIAVDSDGQVWVSDGVRNSIQVFDRSGKLLLIFGSLGIGRGEFNVPAGLFFDVQDRLFVADSYNYRMQVYQYLKADGNIK